MRKQNEKIYNQIKDKNDFPVLEQSGVLKKVGSEVEGSVTVYACQDNSEILLGNEGTYWTREEYEAL